MKKADQKAALSVFDDRPFFEKALAHGLKHGVITRSRLETLSGEAPRGMVQIARHFGSEFLRPQLELARQRLVNLISLHLQSASAGDLQRAAELLRDHSLLSRSKAGSDMLRSMLALPESSHFGMQAEEISADDERALLAAWSLKSYSQYTTELLRRSSVAQVVEAALWFAARCGLSRPDIEDAGKDAEAIIRTALLLHAAGRSAMPHWQDFEKMVLALRKKYAAAPTRLSIASPADLPAGMAQAVEPIRQSVATDLSRLLEPSVAPRKLFEHTPAFLGRYFWLEDPLAEIDHHDRSASATWNKLTDGHTDDASLLTLFLTLAAGVSTRTRLTAGQAATLVRRVRKHGLQADAVHQFIVDNAPLYHQRGYAELWDEFLSAARDVLTAQEKSGVAAAVALLRQECHILA